MPAPKAQPKSEAFLNLHRDSVAAREQNDSCVKAVAVVCGVGYNSALAALTEFGRKSRKDASKDAMRKALWALGFGYDITPIKSILATYPGHRAKLPTLTTYHPVRVPTAWKDRPACIMFAKDHCAAFKDGALHDYANGSAKRVDMVWTIRPITDEERGKLEVARDLAK